MAWGRCVDELFGSPRACPTWCVGERGRAVPCTLHGFDGGAEVFVCFGGCQVSGGAARSAKEQELVERGNTGAATSETVGCVAKLSLLRLFERRVALRRTIPRHVLGSGHVI